MTNHWDSASISLHLKELKFFLFFSKPRILSVHVYEQLVGQREAMKRYYISKQKWKASVLKKIANTPICLLLD